MSRKRKIAKKPETPKVASAPATSTLERILGYFRRHTAVQIAVLVWGVVAPFAGYVGHDFLTYRSEQRTAIRSDYGQVQTQASLIQTQLLDLSQSALGHRPPPTSDELAALRTNMNHLYATAQQVQRRVPMAKGELDEYGSAMVRLQQSAEVLQGPLNGKMFVEAVGNYFVAQDNFNKKITDAESCFFCMNT